MMMVHSSLKSHVLLLLVLLVAAMMPRTVLSSGEKENCFAAFDYGPLCTTTTVDDYTQQELANNVGQTVYWTNENGCWMYATIVFENGVYAFQELPDSTVEQVFMNDCALIINTRLRYCIGTCPSSRSSSRRARLLTQDKKVAAVEDRLGKEEEGEDSSKYQHYVETCGDYQYEASFVIVDTHFYAVAMPVSSEPAKVAGCPVVVTGASFDNNNNNNNNNNISNDSSGSRGASTARTTPPYRKDVWILDEETAKQFLGSDDEGQQHDHYVVGTYPFSELVRAHEQVNPHHHHPSTTTSTTPLNKKKKVYSYDIINFNCADYMLALASALHVKIDAKLTSYVTRRLVQDSGQMLADKIRKSVHYGSLFFGSSSSSGGGGGTAADSAASGHRARHRRRRLGDTKELSDHEVIEALVETRATTMSSSSRSSSSSS